MGTTLSVAACNSAALEPEPTSTVLTIGVPEASVGGANVGIQELTSGFSLEGLTMVGVDGKALPRLAESWSWENGGRGLRVKLREGVTFHDGTPLTSTLVATLLRQATERPANRALYPSFNDIKEIRPEGDLQLVFDLSRESAFLPEELDLPLRFGPENLGTGPYRVVKRNPQEVVFEQYPEYYRGRPRIELVIVRSFETLRTAWTSLLRAEVGMITDVPPEAVEFIRNDDIQVLSFARRYQFLIAFNSQKAPLRDRAVRRALNLAVDREAVIKNVLQNRGDVSTGPLWPQYWAYDASVAPYSYDPEGAKALLDAAGFHAGKAPRNGDAAPARLRFTCIMPEGFSVWERIGLEVQKHLYNIGVDMQFNVIPVDEFNIRMRDGNFDAALTDLITGPTPARAYIFFQSARSFRGFNVFGYENAEAERLFEVLRTTTNEGAVRSATRRLQSVFLDDPPALFLAWSQRARAVSRDFEIVQEPNRDPLLDLWQWAPVAAGARQVLASQ